MTQSILASRMPSLASIFYNLLAWCLEAMILAERDFARFLFSFWGKLEVLIFG